MAVQSSVTVRCGLAVWAAFALLELFAVMTLCRAAPVQRRSAESPFCGKMATVIADAIALNHSVCKARHSFGMVRSCEELTVFVELTVPARTAPKRERDTFYESLAPRH